MTLIIFYGTEFKNYIKSLKSDDTRNNVIMKVENCEEKQNETSEKMAGNFHRLK